MTDLAIVESRADRASVHICEHLRDHLEWDAHEDDTRPPEAGGGTYYRLDGVELRSFEELHLDLERPADAFECDPDLLVFASRHSGETGALLTGHFTGNFGPAEFGGEPDTLAAACPNALAHFLDALEAYAPEGYDVGMECTHHGPTDVGCPSLFAELGSGDEQWDDPDAAAAVARAIADLRDSQPHNPPRLDDDEEARVDHGHVEENPDASHTHPAKRQFVGFGGNHYAPRFGRIVRETPWAVGHIAADWALEAMDHPSAHEDVLEAAFETSRADIAVLDGEWPVLESTLEDLGYRIVSETWIRSVRDRSLEVVDAVESELGAIDEGVRFGDHRTPSFTIADLPADLVDTAEGIDAERVRTVVESRTVAFETDNGGSRIGSRIALPVESDSHDEESSGPPRVSLVEELAAVLEEKYDSVTLEDEGVVAERTTFDPELAHTLGIPEGPKFGALADGESITVNGESIDPETVHSRQIERFPL
ncbi:D-aminoacyl-tRNA deacylase [Natronorubrum sediminis]|uniref:D-aminoacyl-tRNA deacylase n=1 Tax=Natronorubrum sediminis TaxID=640943 RepID=A0A1H6FMB2_9EURY|nr:D-aminoacyl-tRNA deacylase [Natronorubrum sediminis]SEH12027.1 D-aminoacyl-tRNA deacylase [Natronorubrum sediminis]